MTNEELIRELMNYDENLIVVMDSLDAAEIKEVYFHAEEGVLVVTDNAEKSKALREE